MADAGDPYKSGELGGFYPWAKTAFSNLGFVRAINTVLCLETDVVEMVVEEKLTETRPSDAAFPRAFPRSSSIMKDPVGNQRRAVPQFSVQAKADPEQRFRATFAREAAKAALQLSPGDDVSDRTLRSKMVDLGGDAAPVVAGRGGGRKKAKDAHELLDEERKMLFPRESERWEAMKSTVVQGGAVVAKMNRDLEAYQTAVTHSRTSEGARSMVAEVKGRPDRKHWEHGFAGPSKAHVDLCSCSTCTKNPTAKRLTEAHDALEEQRSCNKLASGMFAGQRAEQIPISNQASRLHPNVQILPQGSSFAKLMPQQEHESMRRLPFKCK